MFADLINRDDMVVFKCGDSLSLPLKPATCDATGRQNRTEHFECNHPLQRFVLCSEDDSHATLTQVLQHAESGKASDFVVSLGIGQQGPHIDATAVIAVRKAKIQVAEPGDQVGDVIGECRSADVGFGFIARVKATRQLVAVRQSSVLFVLVLGVFRLRETPGRVRVLGGAATVLGVGLIAAFGGP